MFEIFNIDPVLTPIHALNSSHRADIQSHLLTLGAEDRYLRFGYAAQDAQIKSYTDKLNFKRDKFFGIFDTDLHLQAVAHLAHDPKDMQASEFGVSVTKTSRGKGYGSRLFDRAAMHARNQGVKTMYIHALSENTTMLKIARHAGASIERDGGESAAYLKLPEPTLTSHLGEVSRDQWGLSDYGFKVQANLINRFVSSISSGAFAGGKLNAATSACQ